MGDSADFKEEVSKRLECPICMDRLRNPKDLQCHHTFCKECLDGIVKIRKDGAAIIKCPLRCSEQTVLSVDQTTKDLGAPFHLKGILEMFDGEDDVCNISPLQPPCKAENGCQKNIAMYCSSCSIMMCRTCCQKHEKSHEQHSYIPIQFHEKTKKINIMCTEHSAIAKYACCGGDKFICIYCRNRNHRGHSHQNLETQVKQTKGLLTAHIKKVDKMKIYMKKSLNAAESEINRCRELLNKSLKTRKLICLSNYLAFLNKSEERIQNEFESLATNHIQQYTASDAAEYFKSALQSDVANLILERESILRNIKQWKTGNATIPSLSISLTDANYYDRNSLGILIVNAAEDVSFTDTATKESVFHDIPQPDLDLTPKCSSLIKDLRDLLEEALQKRSKYPGDESDELEGKKIKRGRSTVTSGESSSASISKEEKKFQKKAAKEVLKVLKKQGVNYVFELIKENDEETLDVLLSAKSNVIKMKGAFASTPLLTAARYNRVGIMKKLLNTGSKLTEKGSSGSTVLHIAAFHDSYEALTWLLPQCHQFINQQNDGDKRTALHYTVSNGYLRCMKLLLDNGADLHVKDKDGCTALDRAREQDDNAACVKELQKALSQSGERDDGKYAGFNNMDENNIKTSSM